MPTEHEDLDSNWDSLADELGVNETATPVVPEKQAAPANVPPAKQAIKKTPEALEPADDDFGGGLEETAKQEEEFTEEFDGEEGGSEETAEGTSEEGEGKKKRRRRRRRRKKGGASPEGTAVPDVANEDSGELPAVEETPESTVEEGDAPGELSDSDDDSEESEIHSAVDEEMETASNEPRQEWKVMSWADLIGKLHRPV